MCSTQRCVPSPCPAGYYCPLATVNPLPCGSPSVYCPRGSMTPVTALVGYYTTWKAARGLQADGSRLEDGYIEDAIFARLNLTTRTDQQLCEPGTYCVGGVKRWCLAGTYGASSGLATPQCTGSCPPGYFCPLGTADYARFPCNARDAYCRVGSSAPTPVSTGYSTVTASTGDTRVDQTICPTGSYCIGGVSYLCPAGTFGATTGLFTALCSGRCQDGYVCPRGSTSATQSPCPAGQYSRNGITCAPCAPGYWCSAGSPDPKQNACGSDYVYCPLGSSGPVNVANGFYAAGQVVTTHTTQAQCRVQTVYHLPQCPTRTIGTNSGL